MTEHVGQDAFPGIAGIVGALVVDANGRVVGRDGGGPKHGVLGRLFAPGTALATLATQPGAPALARDVAQAFLHARSRPDAEVRFDTEARRHGVAVRLMGRAAVLEGEGGALVSIALADVTQCRWHDQAVSSADTLRTLMDAIPDVVAIHEGGVLLEANRATEELLGVPRAKLVGSRAEVFAAPGGQEEMRARAEVRGDARYLTELPSADGGLRTLEVRSADCVFEGRAARVAVARDVTREARVERALAASEKRLQGLLDGGFDFVWESDVAGVLSYVSPSIHAALGWRPEELTGKALAELLGPTQADGERERFRLAAEAYAPLRRATRWMSCRDGSERLMESRASPVMDSAGALCGFRGIERDVTAHHEAETLSRLLLAHAPDPLVVVAESGLIVLANRRAEEVFGYGEGELVGLPVESLIPAEAREAHVKNRDDYRRDPSVRVMGTGLSLEAVRRDGSRVPVDVSLSPCVIGSIRLTVAAVRDLTVQRRAEQALRERDEQLRQAQKMEAIGRLAGGVAHDFNNLLTAILGYAEFAEDALPEDHPVRDDLREIRKAGESAAALTQQLLAYSRRQVLRPQVVSPASIVLATEKMLRRLIGEDVEFVFVLDTDAGTILADTSQVQQVLVNLVVNARQAMPRGGRITVETQTVELDAERALAVPPLSAGRYVRLSVTDTGEGMDEATRARIFEPFFTTKATGTGLGLATVHGIVAQSGGHLSVASSPGHGARFDALFPVAAAYPEVEAPPAHAQIGGGGETLLLVEDEDPVRSYEARVLRAAGYTVLEAANGEDAMALAGLTPGRIDLLVTDVVMPGMTGRELSERLGSARPGLRTIFVSGYSADVIAHRGVLDPGAELLTKPFAGPELIARVRSVLLSPGARPAPSRP